MSINRRDKGHDNILFKNTPTFYHVTNISHLDLRPSDPTHSRQLTLQQKVVCFIIEAPLADGQGGTIAFDLKDKYEFTFYD